MGKLAGRGLPSRLVRRPGRFDRARSDGGGASREKAFRAWYNTRRWRKLRLRVFERDGYICQATGVLLLGEAHAPDSPVCDHKVPHRGDPGLFWDEENLQSVSKAWHDSEKQRMERSGVLGV